MDDIIDAIATDASPSEIADSLKDVIFQKGAERVEALRPEASASVFDVPETEIEDESEVDTEPQEEE